jgi:hypothetical protein
VFFWNPLPPGKGRVRVSLFFDEREDASGLKRSKTLTLTLSRGERG